MDPNNIGGLEKNHPQQPHQVNHNHDHTLTPPPLHPTTTEQYEQYEHRNNKHKTTNNKQYEHRDNKHKTKSASESEAHIEKQHQPSKYKRNEAHTEKLETKRSTRM